MKENGLLFSSDMVIAHNADNKTATRRTRNLDGINIYPDDFEFSGFHGDTNGNMYADFLNRKEKITISIKCPYGWIDDLIYMKEIFQYKNLNNAKDGIMFFADVRNNDNYRNVKWRSPLYLRKVEARNWMKIINIKMQRLQNISEQEAKKEGAKKGFLKEYKTPEGTDYSFREDDDGTYYAGFKHIWFKVNNPETWNLNQWVFVLEYEKISKS